MLSPIDSSGSGIRLRLVNGFDIATMERQALRRRVGAFRCHAVRNAASRMSGGTFAKSTRVEPLRPHPPGTGENILGSSSTMPACCCGVSNSTPQPSFSRASVAKIFPPTRKSALPKCEPSVASGRLSAIRRKSAAVKSPPVWTLLSAGLTLILMSKDQNRLKTKVNDDGWQIRTTFDRMTW
jgi:hypothetical protein